MPSINENEFDPTDKGFLAKHGIAQVRQAPHTYGKVPCDFWPFRQRDGTRFQDSGQITTNATTAITKSDLRVPPTVEGSLGQGRTSKENKVQSGKTRAFIFVRQKSGTF